jgi:hypothetical protein
MFRIELINKNIGRKSKRTVAFAGQRKANNSRYQK